MVIDENKAFTPYRTANDIIYTDRCAMIVEFNWRKASIRDLKEKYVINIKKLKEYKGRQNLVDALKKEGNVDKKIQGLAKRGQCDPG